MKIPSFRKDPETNDEDGTNTLVAKCCNWFLVCLASLDCDDPQLMNWPGVNGHDRARPMMRSGGLVAFALSRNSLSGPRL